MRRFFFHLEDGEGFADEDGTVLDDLDAARREAVLLIAQSAADHPDRFWETDGFRVTCMDEHGEPLFSLQLATTAAPALQRRPVLVGTRPQ